MGHVRVILSPSIIGPTGVCVIIGEIIWIICSKDTD
jgi:hypothetical protein